MINNNNHNSNHYLLIYVVIINIIDCYHNIASYIINLIDISSSQPTSGIDNNNNRHDNLLWSLKVFLQISIGNNFV